MNTSINKENSITKENSIMRDNSILKDNSSFNDSIVTVKTEKSVNNICNKHKRVKDICCIECNISICSKCALFDIHKNHTVREIEEVQAEIADNIVKFIDIQKRLIDIKEKVDQKLWLPVLTNKYESVIINKKEEIKSMFNDIRE